MSKIYVRYGVKTCLCGVNFLRLFEQRLKAAKLIKRDLWGLITQGGFNVGGVAASAGTHNKGGAFDFVPALANAKVERIARECGMAAWVRLPIPGVWGLHLHGVIIGCPHLASLAAEQVVAYRAGRNGLANNGKDTGVRVPVRSWKQAYRADYRPVVEKLRKPRPMVLVKETSWRKGPGRAWVAKGPRPKGYQVTITATSGAWSMNGHGNWWPTKALKGAKL